MNDSDNREIFCLPKFRYFNSGNDYSGSRGDFAYKIITGEKFTCLVWHGRLCSEKAEIEKSEEFERSENGLADMKKWLENACLNG